MAAGVVVVAFPLFFLIACVGVRSTAPWSPVGTITYLYLATLEVIEFSDKAHGKERKKGSSSVQVVLVGTSGIHVLARSTQSTS